MKHLFWIGLATVVLGLASFFIQVPQAQRQSLKNTGSISVGVNNTQEKDLSHWVGGVLIVGGLALMVGGCREHKE
jgi:uncharacterized membrane protein